MSRTISAWNPPNLSRKGCGKTSYTLMETAKYCKCDIQRKM